MVRLDGLDTDFVYMSVKSRSRDETTHTVVLCRRSAVLSCTCEDATYRKKKGSVFLPSGWCWHGRIAREFLELLGVPINV